MKNILEILLFTFRLPADCHHPERQKHKCHSGTCPPCRLPCGKTLSCGHICPAKCHSAVLTKIDIKEVCYVVFILILRWSYIFCFQYIRFQFPNCQFLMHLKFFQDIV